MSNYPAGTRAVVTITFIDGEMKSYPISANKGVASRFAELMGETGVLTMWNGERSYGVPANQIREWSIADVALPVPPEEVIEDHGADAKAGLARTLGAAA